MTVDYVSTRGAAPHLGFADVLLTGLAPDGGLYVPDRWPDGPAGLDEHPRYVDLAVEVMWPFVAGDVERSELAALVADAYATFDHPDVTPLFDLGGGLHLLELHHGPTLAFKDVALQLVGRLFDRELARRGERVTIVGATSGDTGSAAIEACRDRAAIDIVILHPHGRVSDVQRRQMTTVDAPNVHNVAVEGTFDDCQDLVKAMFADEAFRRRCRLSAVNSINWARVMAQLVYYFFAASRVGRPLAFAVPTGNFGNVFAGYGASRMGLEVDQLVVGSNRNDILTRFFSTARLERREVAPTLSPSMDIQISSNLERLLFDLLGRDGDAVTDLLARFRSDGTCSLDEERFAPLRTTWSAARLDDDETLDVMARYHRSHGILVDPHTAVGLGAAEQCRREVDQPMVALATAHPAKFPDAVERATGVRPPLPDHLADLYEREERYAVLPADLAAVMDIVGRVADS